MSPYQEIQKAVAEQQRILAALFAPRCRKCNGPLTPGKLKHTATGWYYDSESWCASCVAERNHRLDEELR
jgi:hypothetical protein